MIVSDTISGTTNSPVDVDVWPYGDNDSLVTVTPVSRKLGATLPYDIAPGDFGAAVQTMLTDDVTWINWWVPYTLTVNFAGTGSGIVDRVPGGGIYRPGTDVELTATADPGSTFTGWSGDYNGSG